MKSIELNEADGQKLKLNERRNDHLKVACLPIPPYAQPGDNYNGSAGPSEVKNDANKAGLLRARQLRTFQTRDL